MVINSIGPDLALRTWPTDRPALGGALIECTTSLCYHFQMTNPGSRPALRRASQLMVWLAGTAAVLVALLVPLPPAAKDEGTHSNWISYPDRNAVYVLSGPDAPATGAPE